MLAAGRGIRLGAGIPKAFVPLAGEPLVVRSVRALARSGALERILPVLPEAELVRWRELEGGLGDVGGLLSPVAGGCERQDSTRAGLAALPADTEVVAVHDAARCLVRPVDVARVVEVARSHGAALLAVPARDTIKRVEAGEVRETPARESLWVAQTPQVFRMDLLREALEKAEAEGFVGTDDAQLVERLGVTVRVVEGDPGNVKITGPEDLRAAELRLAEAPA